jgi:transposase
MARDRTIHNDVHSDVASLVRPRRVEVLNGIERRRKWTDARKIAIVAETLAPGTVVSDVARRHDLNPSQLFGWVKRFRADAMAAMGPPVVPTCSEPPMFAPAVVEMAPIAATAPLAAERSEPASIEISVGEARVCVRGAADAKTLTLVLKALKVLA